MSHLKFLFEMFMPEARFPDEKFWNKDGSPIHPDPKGPPKGTTGSTHRDHGFWDTDDNPFTGQDIYPNLDSVRQDMPDAYRKLQNVLADIGLQEKDIPEDAFLFNEDGILTVNLPGKDYNHPLFWDPDLKHWEYEGIR